MNHRSTHKNDYDLSERAWQIFSLLVVAASVAAMVYTVVTMINTLMYLVSIW